MDLEICVGDLITNPEISHFHCSGPLLFDGTIDDARHGGIIAVDVSEGQFNSI